MIIEIDGGHSGIRFSACHFIPRHEKCSRLHGHSYILRLRLEGDIGPDGMVMDFVTLKKELRAFAADMDHMVLLPAKSRDASIKSSDGSVEVITCGKRYVFPEEDVRMLDVTVTTAEEMSRMLVDRLVADVRFPSNVKSVAVGLDEERGQTAWYKKDL